MQAATQNNAMSLGRPPSAVYDKVNSIFALTIYYAHHWKDWNGQPTNRMTYYLKYQNDKNYNGVETELQRVFTLIKNNYSLGRKFQSIQLYQNWNKAGQLRNVENSLVFRIQAKGNSIDFIVPEIIGDTNGAVREFVGEQLQEIFDLHTSAAR